jgi:trigger factor
MNITKQQQDDLHAVITVSLDPADYLEPFEKAVKSYAKKANMPGFRPGMVPAGMVKKMVGQSLMAEEVNRILQRSLQDYFEEQQFDLMGNALPSDEDKDKDLPNWQSPSTLDYKFDIAFAPSFELQTGSGSYTRRYIQVSDDQIENQINRLKQRFGSISYPETIEKNDLVYADITELQEDGEVKPGGVFVNGPLWIESIKDEETLAAFLGKKKDDVIEADIQKLAANETDRAALLKIKPEELAAHGNTYRVKITAISRMQPAEMNAEFFAKVFGEEVDNEEAFRTRIRRQIEDTYKKDSDTLLYNEIQKTLIEQNPLTLPEAFIKRWIAAVSEKPMTSEEIEADFDNYRKYLHWKLIEKKLTDRFEIKVEADDLKNYLRNFYISQYTQYVGSMPEEENIQAYVNKSLRERKEIEGIADKIVTEKLIDAFEKHFQVTSVFMDEEKFYETQTP